MNTMARQAGVSLIELMIGVAIIGIISAIAIPQYQDYVQTAQEGVMSENMNSIRLFQEEIRLSEGAYAEGTYDPNDPSAAGGLTEIIGWAPRTSDDQITYVVDEITAGSFQVTATHTDGTVVQKTYSRP